MTAPTEPEVQETEGNESSEELNGTGQLSLEDLQKELAKVRREAAGYRVKAKENEQAKSELDKIRESQMSDLEKAQARIKALEEENTKTSRQAALDVAKAKYGFDDDDLEFISGDTPEAIAAAAEKLAKRLGSKNEGESASGGNASGNPNLFPGVRGKPVGAGKDDMNELLRRQLRGEA
jgi:hypothetical protein